MKNKNYNYVFSRIYEILQFINRKNNRDGRSLFHLVRFYEFAVKFTVQQITKLLVDP